MDKAKYILFLFSTKISAAIPFWLLYRISDVVFPFVCYVLRYRKVIVTRNIANAFPELSEVERTKIVTGFYRNLCDIMLEGFKGFTVSAADLKERYHFLNPEIMNHYYSKGKEVISCGAHFANWEWGIMAGALQFDHKIVAFYQPFSNKYINGYMLRNRTRFGTELITKSDVGAPFEQERSQTTTFFFGADQSPKRVDRAHWMTFLNQETACMTGPGIFSQKYDMPIVYFDVQRVKRGYYSVELVELERAPTTSASNAITEKYMRMVESIIRTTPEHYFWSHNRWRHRRD